MNANTPAYPRLIGTRKISDLEEEIDSLPGLTKRELIAAMALQGYLSAFANSANVTATNRLAQQEGISTPAMLAKLSTEAADALLTQLEQP